MNNLVITLAREYGSGGRYIGQLVAEKLGIKCYDNEIISEIAKESGFAEEFITSNESNTVPSFLYSLYMDSGVPSVYDQLYIAQSDAIKKLAKQEPCVIVGRCADYVLRHHDNLIKLFIYAPMESKIKRLTEIYKEEAKNPEQYIKKKDKKRSSYYEYTTQHKWGVAQNYDICLNSDIGVDKASNVIALYVKESGRL